MKIARYTLAAALAGAILLTAVGPAQAQKASPTATLDAMITQKRAELKELQDRKKAVRQATAAERQASRVARLEAQLAAAKEGKPAPKAKKEGA